MNQPTEDRIKHLEEEQRQLKDGQKRLEEEVRQLREQRTEEIKAVRVEVASEDVINRLKTLEGDTTVLKDDVGVLKIEMKGARADIRVIKANQSDLRGYIEEEFKVIGKKQDEHQELIGQLISVGEDHTKRFDKIDENIAEQGQKLDLILKLLQSRGE